MSDAKLTAQLGAAVLVWLAGSCALNAILISFTGESLFSSRSGGYADDYDRYSTLFVYMVGVIAGAWLASRLWFRYSVGAAWAGLIWLAADAVASVAMGTSPPALSILFILFAAQGVRGAHAVRRLTSALPTDVANRIEPRPEDPQPL